MPTFCVVLIFFTCCQRGIVRRGLWSKLTDACSPLHHHLLPSFLMVQAGVHEDSHHTSKSKRLQIEGFTIHVVMHDYGIEPWEKLWRSRKTTSRSLMICQLSSMVPSVTIGLSAIEVQVSKILESIFHSFSDCPRIFPGNRSVRPCLYIDYGFLTIEDSRAIRPLISSLPFRTLSEYIIPVSAFSYRKTSPSVAAVFVYLSNVALDHYGHTV